MYIDPPHTRECRLVHEITLLKQIKKKHLYAAYKKKLVHALFQMRRPIAVLSHLSSLRFPETEDETAAVADEETGFLSCCRGVAAAVVPAAVAAAAAAFEPYGCSLENLGKMMHIT